MALVFPLEVRSELFERLAEIFRTKTTAEWADILRRSDHRCAVVRDHAAIAEDAGAYENGNLQRIEHPEWGEVPMVGCPIRLSDTPAKPGVLAPELGQHTEEVLLELGMDWDRIAALREAGAIWFSCASDGGFSKLGQPFAPMLAPPLLPGAALNSPGPRCVQTRR
jgi:crotonobetainyl-CoA:carnitine CoA-transferase CaiB-like acyl-CoA transferase